MGLVAMVGKKKEKEKGVCVCVCVPVGSEWGGTMAVEIMFVVVGTNKWVFLANNNHCLIRPRRKRVVYITTDLYG